MIRKESEENKIENVIIQILSKNQSFPKKVLHVKIKTKKLSISVLARENA